MKNSLFTAFFFLALQGFAQQTNPDNLPQNTADKLLGDNNQLSIGGYGQVDYNQTFGNGNYNTGKLDVHRLVMMFGYKFTDDTKFITEIEFEHVSEVYIEQAFLQHRINDFINVRAGLMLVPMGFINEYHEPLLFNGVERPNVDTYIVPTTWREIGAGITGRIDFLRLKYQAYVMNGFNGYNGAATFTGKDGLRKGRQKGIESYMSSPTFSTKFDYYGFRNLKIGMAYYGGKSQSTLFNGIEKTNDFAVAQADSSVVNINMLGVDATYTWNGFTLKGQLIYTHLANAAAYNAFGKTDVGSAMLGYYAEVGYNLFKQTKLKSELIPFVRFEHYDTQYAMANDVQKNPANSRTEIITGLGWKITPGSVVKIDYQRVLTAANGSLPKNILNMGIGVWF